MERVPSHAVPHQKDHDEHNRPEERGAGVGDMDIEMEKVGYARAEDSDGIGKEPVGEGPVPSGPELEHQSNDEQGDLGPAAANVSPGLQVVRGGFATGGGEDLDDPEEEDDLGDLGRLRPREHAVEEGCHRCSFLVLVQIGGKVDRSVRRRRTSIQPQVGMDRRRPCLAGGVGSRVGDHQLRT